MTFSTNLPHFRTSPYGGTPFDEPHYYQGDVRAPSLPDSFSYGSTPFDEPYYSDSESGESIPLWSEEETQSASSSGELSTPSDKEESELTLEFIGSEITSASSSDTLLQAVTDERKEDSAVITTP